MGQLLKSHRTCTEQEYRAALRELERLHGGNSSGVPDAYAVDELLDLIENYEAAVRFVPEFFDDPRTSFADAA